MIAEAFLNSIFAELFISVLLAAFSKTIRMTFRISAQNLNGAVCLPQKTTTRPFCYRFLSLLHRQHEARCGAGGVDLPIRPNDATLGGDSPAPGVRHSCLRT